MLMAWFLGEPSIRELRTWKVLSDRFFIDNRPLILRYCGFNTGRLSIERIRVDSPELFLAYMSALFRTGMVHCTYEEFANYIDLVFDTGYEIRTICNHLKEADDVFFDICEAVRKEKKKHQKTSSGIDND